MTTQHTPGPWSHRKRNDHHIINPVENKFFDVAKVSGAHTAEIEANARLIAAAPDLLRIAEELLKFIKFADADDFKGLDANWRIQKLEAAIAKAKGQS